MANESDNREAGIKVPGAKTKPSALVLAAGRSTRMGAFKPLLPFGDSCVIQCCIRYLVNGGVGNIVVVLGHRAAEVQSALQTFPVKFAFNPDPDSPMSDSIACGIRELPPDGPAAFITPADYPAVPCEVVVTLTKYWQSSPAKLLLPEYHGRGGHPVLVDLCFRNELLDLDPQRGLRSLFDAHREQVARIPVNSPFIARDIDTWEDYCALYREVVGSEPSELMPNPDN